MLATGLRASLALEGARSADAQRAVVSLPCWELFDAQPEEYRDEVLPPSVTARVSIEAGVTFGWERYVGPAGTSVGVDRFGASAPYERIYEELGLTPQAVADARRGASPDAGRGGFDHRGSRLREAVLAGVAAAGHEALDLGVDTDAVRVDYPDSRATSARRSARDVQTAASSSAGRASAPPWPPARSLGSARRSATTPTRRTRASSTTT